MGIERRLGLILLIAVLFTILVSPAFCEEKKKKDVTFKVDGHVLSLWTFIKDGVTGDNYTFNTNRLRLEMDTKFKKKLLVKVIYDLEAFSGNIVDAPFWNLIKNPQQNAAWDLTGGKKFIKGIYLRQSVYRAYASYDAKFARVIAGKQRIAWGVMRFFRPTDLFNPESPLQIESGERPGIDAVKVNIPFTYDVNLETVYAPQSKFKTGEVFAGKYHFLIGQYDCTLVGGKIRNNNVAGLTFDGYVGDGGFRGEILRVDPQFSAPYYLWTVGGDYSFPNTLTVTLEYMNNGGAQGFGATQLLPFSGILQTRRRQFAMLGLSYRFNPLVNGSLFTSYDIEGKSIAVSPRVTWDYKQNLELSAGAVLFGGKKGGEYSNASNTIFTQAKFYF